MKDYILNPPREQWDALSERPSTQNPAVRERVLAILARVKQQGDDALRALSLEIEGRPLDALEVTPEERLRACEKVSKEVKKAIGTAMEQIEKFHAAQKPKDLCVETAPGVRCFQKSVPIQKVGLYIPGGQAPLFSTVLMLAIPARLAGCRERILCSPAGKDGEISPEVIYAADICGVQRIFRLGGAQAIAAIAYGTETIPRVDKIFGPGNQYVTQAKQLLSASTVAIDMPAGPSEVLVMADDSTNPSFAAADLLSQAEHGPDSQVILVSKTAKAAESILKEVERQCRELPRSAVALQSLEKSRALVFEDAETCLDFANYYAPEHLIIATENAWSLAERVTAAGSVFVGPYTPESAGDYASGTNHTLPTCGWARSFGGVCLDSFCRKMTLQEISREGLQGLSSTIITMAQAEGLDAHANAVKIRLQ